MFIRRIRKAVKNLAIGCISCLLLAASVIPPADEYEQVRMFTRTNEFNYITWTADAIFDKTKQSAADVSDFLTDEQQKDIVYSYIDTLRQYQILQAEINLVYGNPEVQDPLAATESLMIERNAVQRALTSLSAQAESIIQSQISLVLDDLGLSVGGEIIPPVLYRVSSMPYALITSPRDKIEQTTNISLNTGMALEEIIELENSVEVTLGVSALVEEVGGVGVYPTMVMESTNLPWFIDTVAHEWIHNYLTLRPLGLSYDVSNELRTMNETTASIGGAEISLAVLQRFYPELAPKPAPEPAPNQPAPQEQEQSAVFDFRAEMHETRINVDTLLSQGKIEEAEKYMEERRVFLWENGYQIRRLNQAYFAFHGAYADSPIGAAGEDPVGPQVRKLRENSASLAEFINRISWLSSFEDLQKAVADY